VCDLLKQINQRLIRLSVLRLKARDRVEEIRAIERRSFVDLACQETLSQRAIGNETDPKFLKRRQHFLLRFSEPKRVFALDTEKGFESLIVDRPVFDFEEPSGGCDENGKSADQSEKKIGDLVAGKSARGARRLEQFRDLDRRKPRRRNLNHEMGFD
jgi:hypothetical protein